MIFVWNLNSELVGLLFGLGFGGSYFFVADELILNMQRDEPDDEFINSNIFILLMKYIIPIVIILGSALLIGPLFAWIYHQLVRYDSILGMDSNLVFVCCVLTFSLLLDIAVFLTRTPFPVFKLFSNTWMFLILGLLLHILMS